MPRSLNRFQQLNAVKISGIAVRPLDEALRFMEDEAAKILPTGYVIDYTGESRQLRTEGNRVLPAFNLAIILIFLALAAQFNSFRDPFVILRFGPPGCSAPFLHVLRCRTRNPLDERLDHHPEFYSQAAWSPWSGGVEERHPDRRLATDAVQGASKLAAAGRRP